MFGLYAAAPNVGTGALLPAGPPEEPDFDPKDAEALDAFAVPVPAILRVFPVEVTDSAVTHPNQPPDGVVM